MSRVIKFGGTSLDTPAHRADAVALVKKYYAEDPKLTVVVSAMGRKGMPYATDTLLSVIGKAEARIRDFGMCSGEILSCAVMAAALQQVDIPALPMTGGQAGILTDGVFGQAEAICVDDKPQISAWMRGRVPVVCGFQGRTAMGELATLGRGGSDTTASLLAEAVQADEIVIVTDVPGLRQMDPRWLPKAPLIPNISFEQMQYLAESGAGIVHPRAVGVAAAARIPIWLRTATNDEEKTCVGVEIMAVQAMAAQPGWARIETDTDVLAMPDMLAEAIADTLTQRGERVSVIRDLARLTVLGVPAQQARKALDEEQIPCLGSEAAPDGCVLWVWQYDLRGAAEAVQRMMR